MKYVCFHDVSKRRRRLAPLQFIPAILPRVVEWQIFLYSIESGPLMIGFLPPLRVSKVPDLGLHGRFRRPALIKCFLYSTALVIQHSDRKKPLPASSRSELTVLDVGLQNGIAGPLGFSAPVFERAGMSGGRKLGVGVSMRERV